jgi:hypothetical protein
MVDESTATTSAAKAPRERSPSYPFISLKGAIARLVAFDGTFGRHATPIDKVGLAWGMKGKSSQVLQTTAAMKSFGLVEYMGSGDSLTVAPSTDGRNYLRAQQESVKAEILKRCALKPKAIQRCWQVWGADRPIDAVCLDELVLKQAFTDSAARTFLKVYDDTVAFAGLHVDSTIQSQEDASDASEEETDMQQPAPQAAQAKLQPPAVMAMPDKMAPAAGFYDETYHLDGGRAFVVRRPEKLSPEELDEFDVWVELLRRKMKRLAQQ